MRLFSSKRRLAAVGAVTAIALAGSGAAFAYFTSSGTGTGTGSVGSAGTYTVVVSAPTGGPLTPGGATEAFTYTVKNNGTGTEQITTASVGVTPDATAAAAGCLASWYQVSGPGITAANPATQTYLTPISINGGATSTDPQLTFTVSLLDEPVQQNACAGDLPVVTVTAS